MKNNAIGFYALTESNKKNLNGFSFLGVETDVRLNMTCFVFHDEYRKMKIDLLVNGQGDLFIGDYYGESMKRKDIFYIKNDPVKKEDPLQRIFVQMLPQLEES